MVFDKRLEVLFDSIEYERLKSLAGKKGRSIGELVREAVRDKYLTATAQERESAVRRLLSLELELEWPEWDQIEQSIARGGINHGEID